MHEARTAAEWTRLVSYSDELTGLRPFPTVTELNSLFLTETELNSLFLTETELTSPFLTETELTSLFLTETELTSLVSHRDRILTSLFLTGFFFFTVTELKYRKQRWLLAFEETNQNTQEVKMNAI